MSLQEGQTVQLSEQYKDYPQGLTLTIKALRDVGPKKVAQCIDPSGTYPGTLGIPAEKLVAAGAVPAAAADEGENNLEGPVTDFFSSRHTFDNPVALNFALKFIEVNGQGDLTDVLALMEARGIAQDRQWNELEVAQLYLDYLDSIAEDQDPEALAVVAKYTTPAPAVVAPPTTAPAPAVVPPPVAAPTTAPAPAVVPPPVAPPAGAPVPPPVAPPAAAPAAAEAPKSKGKKGAAAAAVDPGVAASAPTQSVDSNTWEARTMQALRIQGQLAQFYAESPSTFNDDLSLALKMLAAAAKAKA
jgi:outer membrane biosynthesis protein TonB